jgi:hypothetical protein
MTLSVHKLEKFLARYEMIPNNFFIDKNGFCVYVEIFTLKNNNSFMLNIPSKYRMVVEYKTNIFQLNKHDIDEDGDLVEQLTDKNATKKIENGYDEIVLNKHLGVDNNIQINTEDKYNRPIKISEKETATMKGMYRQVRRLGLCMQGTRYGICVQSSSHMYCDKNDINIEGYSVTSDEHKHKYMKFFVIVDIELLYTKIKNISTDVHDIKTSISNVLIKNFTNHVKTISDTFTGYDIKKRELIITGKVNEYKTRLVEVEKILTELVVTETKLLEKRSETEDQLKLKNRNMLNRDIEKTKHMRTYDVKLSEIIDTKKELFRNILSLKIKHDNVILLADDVLFDVAVMSEFILRKMNTIDQL